MNKMYQNFKQLKIIEVGQEEECLWRSSSQG